MVFGREVGLWRQGDADAAFGFVLERVVGPHTLFAGEIVTVDATARRLELQIVFAVILEMAGVDLVASDRAQRPYYLVAACVVPQTWYK